MNLNNEYFLKRRNNIIIKKQILYNTLKNEPKMTLRMKKYNINNSNFVNNTTYNKKIKNVNSLNNSINNSLYNNKNRTQINQDIIGYNNYIINGNTNLNSLDISTMDVKKKNSFSFNKNNVGLSTYLKNSKFNNLNKSLRDNNKSINTLNNSNNYNSSFYNNNNTDIDYMNMKLNFRLLEQKISKLNNIILPNTNTNNTTYNDYINNTDINNINFTYDNYFIKEYYPIKKYVTDIYSNLKLEKFLKKIKII